MKNSIYIILSLTLILCLSACQNETTPNQSDSKYKVQTSSSEKVKVGDDLRLENGCIDGKTKFEENSENYIIYQVDKNGLVIYSGSVDNFAFNGETEKLTDRVRVGNAYFKLEFIIDIKCQFVKGVRLKKARDGQKWDITQFKLIRV